MSNNFSYCPVTKLSLQVNLIDLQNEVNQLINTVGLDKNNNQLSLMHSTKCTNTWFDGTGSLTLKTSSNQDFNVKETDFKFLNSELNGTYIAEAINILSTQFFVFRARIMVLKPRNCYSWHKDTSQRCHVALTTNKDCFLAFEKGCYHIPADGCIYHTDTQQYHSAFNGSVKEDRVHFVACVLNK
jgi:hypothetical protein